MTREIVLDTETTGIDPEQGHRIVEIGCVELINHVPSGKTLQLYINPERSVPPEASAVHGLSNDFLKDKPVFSEVYSDFLAFIGDARLIIHNAPFDMKFLNWELKQVGHEPIPMLRVLDTLDMARRQFPGSPASLDALCKRFGVDNTGRHYHGALLDSELLAEVYLELIGGRQHGLSLLSQSGANEKNQPKDMAEKKARPLRVFEPSPDELAAHEALMGKLKNPLWRKQSS
jgi:DNA polymerase-3 subunit epsilon